VFRRFMILVFAFLFSMFLLVFSQNLLLLFVAWDLLGFSSLFLVFFYRSPPSLSGGMLTGVTNRFGDVILLLFFALSPCSTSWPLSRFVSLLVLVSITKSAQLPFSAWLPAAMLAPTPVSALVHSSTLVTAGVYLLFRFYPLGSGLLSFIGILTMILAGVAAFFEVDIKKIIALRTLSHLGVIVSALGLGERYLAFAHLNIHANFKALLFLASGSLIHTMYGSQEARSIGGLVSSSPLVLICLVVSCLSITGFVFLSGFVSKEAILRSTYNSSSPFFTLLIFYFGFGVTVIYSVRLLMLVSFSGIRPTSMTSMTRHGMIPKFSLFLLLLCSTSLGVVLFRTLVFAACSLNSIDALAIYFCLRMSCCLGGFYRPKLGINRSPLVSLQFCSSFISSCAVDFGGLHNTEALQVHGFGVSNFGSLFSLKGGRFLFLVRACVLVLVFALCL